MTQEATFSPVIAPMLPDAFSHALMQIVNRVQPSIVQVVKEGRGAGTGIVWKIDGHDGFIITNHHVVPDDATKIQVHLSDGRSLDAKVIDRHKKSDVAMLSVNADNLQAVEIADSASLRVGEWVFAVGNPWGQRGVVTAGIISGVSASKTEEGNGELPIRYIKSDVILAPGNSGGPLLNADGMVVGVNAMVFGGDLAVSIPSNVVSSWIAGLSRRRQISLGIEVETVDLPAALRQKAGVGSKRDSGLLVVALETGELKEQPAGSGLLIGDLLLDAAGKSIDDATSLLDIVARKDREDSLRMRLVRGGNVLTLDVAVAALEHRE
ncbi:MAG TPA: peptidase S1 [Ktedonobacter sp.]|jgi:serine protease Do|nr:peptidase S1 [Ktedonobacter sp.]HAG98195.1 peptidase S1 [Ktedonobacter sp.]HAT46766.1 peptidase S1 [Ktedonobacter sp.]HBE25598.1 peptidase S1 [Ktedonobacter sp.]HCJ34912.1 peptidase S1 [Ktedonobacter sp.]